MQIEINKDIYLREIKSTLDNVQFYMLNIAYDLDIEEKDFGYIHKNVINRIYDIDSKLFVQLSIEENNNIISAFFTDYIFYKSYYYLNTNTLELLLFLSNFRYIIGGYRIVKNENKLFNDFIKECSKKLNIFHQLFKRNYVSQEYKHFGRFGDHVLVFVLMSYSYELYSIDNDMSL